jgi:hypothetical protein
MNEDFPEALVEAAETARNSNFCSVKRLLVSRLEDAVVLVLPDLVTLPA